MKKNEYTVLGVMSGTSVDGIDMALVRFRFLDYWKYEFLCCETVPYSISWAKKLANLTHLTNDLLEEVDIHYTEYLSKVINSFIKSNQIKNIDFIASHGHTAKHLPSKNLTFQIGNRSELATLTQSKVICDFRVQDVNLGGQGAPLVPIGDKLLFSDYDYCLNLGGFANISTEKDNVRIAYDICPVNIVMNQYARKLGFEFDKDGKLANSGSVNHNLLNKLNALDFYTITPPKSLGLEWVENVIFPLIDSFNISVQDILRTFLEHATDQIAREFKMNPSRVLITGGGAFNSLFINTLKNKTSCELVLPPKQLIEYKEALVFALLGVLRYRNEINCLASVTGAKSDHSSGKIYEP